MHKLEWGAGKVLKQDAANVRWAAHAGRPERCSALTSFQPFDQLTQILRWRAFLCDDDRTEFPRYQRDRCEILRHVILKRVYRAVYDMGAPDTNPERVTVRSRSGDPTHTYCATCTG